jgi:hypothetical protein
VKNIIALPYPNTAKRRYPPAPHISTAPPLVSLDPRN